MISDELAAIGQQLRAVRLESGYSLQAVASATKIRLKFLEGIEAGEADPNLSELQLRGFLRNYAAYLNLDLDAMLAAYQQLLLEHQTRRTGIFKSRKAEETPIVPIIPLKQTGVIKTPPHPIPRVVTRLPTGQTQPVNVVEQPRRNGWLRWLVVGFLLLLVMGAGLVIGLPLLADQLKIEIEGSPTAAPLAVESEVTVITPDSKWQEATATPILTPTASGIIISPPSQPNMTGAESVSIAITAKQRSWVRVTVDGTVQYEGLLRPGTGLQYQGKDSVALRTSNAGGLEVVVNNQALGTLGGRGELYDQTFLLNALSSESTAVIPQGEAPADSTLPTPLPVPTLIATPEATPSS